MPSIHVVGSSNTDFVVNVPVLPRPGETITGGSFAAFQGGKGANQAVACARAAGLGTTDLGGTGSGLEVHLIAAVGDDEFGEQARAALRAEGLDISGLQRVEGASGLAFILVDGEGHNMIAVAGGANHRMGTDLALDSLGGARRGDVLLVSMEIPASVVRKALEHGHGAGMTCILNPAPIPRGGFHRDLLRWVDVLTPNELEFDEICSGSGSREERAHALAREHSLDLVVTLGERGSQAVVHVDGGGLESLTQPAFAVRALDTVGAGDCSSGALAVATAERRAWRERLRFAAAAAGLCVTRRGAQPSLPHREEIEALLRADG